MAVTDPIAPEPRRSSIGLVWSLWLGVAIIVLIVVAVAVVKSAGPPVPRFLNATLCLSGTDGHEFAWAGLQEPKGFGHTSRFKFVDKNGGATREIEWRLLRSSAASDRYEFRILADSNLLPIIKRIDVSTDPVELLKTGDVVVTIRDRVFD